MEGMERRDFLCTLGAAAPALLLFPQACEGSCAVDAERNAKLRTIAITICAVALGLPYRFHPPQSDLELGALFFKWVDIPLSEFEAARVEAGDLEILRTLAQTAV
jgi:hypothetical protein